MSDVGGSAHFDVTVDTSGVERLGTEAAAAQKMLRDSLEDTDSAVGRLRRRLLTLQSLNGGAGPRISAQFRDSSRAVQQLGNDLQALVARTKAFQRSFQGQGLDPDLLRLQTNQLERLLDLQRRTQADMRRIVADPAVRRAYELEFNEIARVLTREGQQLVSIQRDNNAERARLAREGARERAAAEALGLVEARRLARLDTITAATSGRTAGAIAQTQGQLAITQARAAGQARVAITRGVVDTIGRLERGLGVTVAGIARTTTSAVARLWDGTVGTVRRSFTTRRQIISGGLQNETRLFSQQSIQIQRIQQQTSRGLIGAARFGGLGAGLAGGLGAGALLTQGFERAANIENIQKRLNVLLNNNVFASRALFLQLAAFAKTTAFDLTGVADLGSRLLAANVAAEDVLPNIKALAGAITLVGGTTDDLNGIARALGQVISVGKLTGEEINQISERLPGLNVRQLFSDALGFENTAAFVKAQEAGEITGEAAVAAFFKAVRGDPRFAQALEEGANSFSNLRANAIESFQDIGAAIVERLEGPIKNSLRGVVTAFSGLASFIRGGELSGGLELLRIVLGKIGIALLGIVAAKGAVEVFQLLGKGVGLLLTPMGALSVLLTAAGAAFLFFFQRSEAFRDLVLDLRDRAAALGRSLGDILVRRLRELGQILEPVVERLQEFGRRIAGIFSAVRQAFQQGGFSRAFRTLLQGLGSLGADALRALEPLRERIADALTDLGDLGGRIRDRIVESLRSINFGVVLDFLRTGFGQAVAGGLGAAIIGGLLGGPLGAALGVGIAALIGRFVIPAIQRAFRGLNAAELFGRFLEGVRDVGRRIAEFLTDRRTLLAAVGIVGAAVAIGAQFVRGFVEGVLSNLGDIVSVGQTLLEALFDTPPIVKAAAALLLVFGRQLVAGLRSIGREAGTEAARGIAEGATQQSAINGIVSRLRPKFVLAGQALGASLSLGLAAALSGSAFGEAETNIDRVAGLASTAATAISAFTTGTALSGGNVAVGAGAAAASLALSGLTAVMAANAKAAQANRDAVEGLAEALVAAGEAGSDTAPEIASFVQNALKGLSAGAKNALSDAGFSADEFTRLVIGDAEEGLAGTGESAASKYLQGFLDGLRPGETGAEGALNFLIGDTLTEATGLFEGREQSRALADEIEGVLVPAAKNVQSAFGEANAELALFGQSDGGDPLRGTGEQITEVIRKLREAKAEKAGLLQEQRAAALDESLSRIRNRAQEIGDKATESRRKLQELLAPPESTADATSQTITNLGGLGQQLTEGLNLSEGVQTALGNAQVQQAVRGFGLDVAAQISQALTEENPGQALQDSVAQTRLAIAQAPELSQEAKDAFIAELDRQFGIAETKIPVGVEANEQEAQAAGLDALAAATQAAVTSGGMTITAAADLLSAVEAGQITVETAQGILTATPTIVGAIPNMVMAASAGGSIFAGAQASATADDIVINNVVGDFGAGSAAGRTLADGVAAGIRAGLGAVQSEATRMMNLAAQAARAAAQSASPSRVFMRIGEDLMEGLAIGIRDNSDEVVSAIQAVVDRITDPRSPLQRGLQEGVSSLFSNLFERSRILSGGGVQLAATGITSAFRDILETVESNAGTLFGIGAKPANERTLAERLLLGESFTSLRIGDEFGVANRSSIQQAVDAVLAYGEALLQQGISAQQTANLLDNYRSSLIQTAVSAGLSTAEVVKFIDSLGLSPQAISRFVSEVNTLNAAVNEARAGVPAAPSLAVGPNPQTQFFQFEEGAVTIAVPDGADGEFVALTTVNAIAQAVR